MSKLSPIRNRVGRARCGLFIYIHMYHRYTYTYTYGVNPIPIYTNIDERINICIYIYILPMSQLGTLWHRLGRTRYVLFR